MLLKVLWLCHSTKEMRDCKQIKKSMLHQRVCSQDQDGMKMLLPKENIIVNFMTMNLNSLPKFFQIRLHLILTKFIMEQQKETTTSLNFSQTKKPLKKMIAIIHLLHYHSRWLVTSKVLLKLKQQMTKKITKQKRKCLLMI